MARAKQQQISFPPFRLDGPEQRLYCNDQLVPLRPKSFEVLHYLSERPGKLVSKEELLEAVWPGTAVTDTVLKVCIREIRDALGDDAASSRFIETAHRRGYRFIAQIEDLDHQTPAQVQHLGSLVVGREEELARLDSLFQKALAGERQLVFVTGEPGIGKTTLVQSFQNQAVLGSNVLIARGQCLEQYGSSEAYLPMLEAISRLCRERGGETVVATLRKHAPTWVAQIPWLVSDSTHQSEIFGATRERMLREMAEAIETITAGNVLLLVLEDLHWSDYSTLDLIAYLARRREASRLMVIGTYRPADVFGKHPLNAMKQELQAHRQCEELGVPFLNERAIAQHIAAQFPRNQFPSDLPQLIHQHTDGNPMFIVNLVDFFVTKGLIAQVNDEWVLTEALERVEVGMPDNVRQIIEKQVENLSDQEQRVLETASVAGVEFSTSIIAATLDQHNIYVEDICAKLAERHLFIRFVGTSELPRGEVAARYGFIHALYQNALYDRLPVAKRAHLHKKLAEHLELALDDRAGEMAGELAVHFEKGRDYRRAVRYLQQAVQNASSRSANREAEALSLRGLKLLAKLDDEPERIQLELIFQTNLAAALSTTQGYGATEVEQAYTRARELCGQFGNNRQLAPVLWGLWRFYLIRSELKIARELSQHLFELAQGEQDAALLVGAHLALGTTFNNLGDFESARNHFEQGLSLCEPAQQNTYLSFYGSDPSVTLRSFNAWALSSLGYSDLALATAREAASLAEELRHPETLCFATFFNAWVHQLRREPEETLKYAQATIELANKNGLVQWIAFGSSLHGWALAEQGCVTEGIAEMRATLATYCAIGSEISRPHFLGLLAEALIKTNQLDEGNRVLSDALHLVDSTDQRYYESELLRLRGELLARGGDADQAAACFQSSIEVARKQKARSFELRAAESLARLK